MNQEDQVLVLGATSDMAMATGRLFAEKGFDVVLAARDVDRLKGYAADLKYRYDVSVDLKEFDASDFNSHKEFANGLEERCSIVICAFGYLGDQDQAVTDWEEASRIITANYTGAVSILNCITEPWKSRKKGTVIGISSVAGDRGRSSNFMYGSAKGAFTTYLSGLRNSLYHHGIHVVTINPGFVATKMTDHLDLPPMLTSSPEYVAKMIYKSYRQQKNIVYVSPIWRIIMLIIKSVPEFIFKRLKM